MWVTTVLAVMTMGATVHADARLHGTARFERIKGQPQAGYQYLYETNLYLTPHAPGQLGLSRRVGAPPPEEPGPVSNSIASGYFSFTVPAGSYSLLLNQPDFYIRPKVISNIELVDGQVHEVHVDLPIEYSTYTNAQDWTGSEGDVWYQTFVATGASITGVSFRIANQQNDLVEVAIVEDNGEASPTSWTVVGQRLFGKPVTLGDNWVRWRSGEVRIVPGRRYAVRLTGGALQPLKRDKDQLSYEGGQAFNKNGEAREFDLDIVVMGDNDGTCVTMNHRVPAKSGTPGTEADRAANWGLTFVARGTSLASADLFAAGTQGEGWRQPFRWQVRADGPSGAPIGAARHNVGAWFGPGTGLYGVSFGRGQIPLTPGQTYYLEILGLADDQTLDSPAALTPYFMSGDSNDEGSSYREGQTDGRDLNMTIVQYTDNTCLDPVASCVGDECNDPGPSPDDNDEPDGGIDGVSGGCTSTTSPHGAGALFALVAIWLRRRRAGRGGAANR